MPPTLLHLADTGYGASATGAATRGNSALLSGTWQAWAHLYDQRLVVYTRLLG